MLGAERHRRHCAWTAVTAAHEHGSVLANTRPQNDGGARGVQHPVRRRLDEVPPERRPAAGDSCCGRYVRLVAGVAWVGSISADEIGKDRLRHHDRALELRSELIRRLATEEHWRPHDITRGWRTPGVSISDQWQVARLDH